MGIVNDILDMFQVNPTRASQMLAELHSRYACVYVHPDDGHLQEFEGGSWKAVDGQLTYVIGEVERTGVEDWSGLIEPYLEICPPGESPKRVFLNGIQIGGFVDDASLLSHVRQALPGDDPELLRRALEDTGFRPL